MANFNNLQENIDRAIEPIKDNLNKLLGKSLLQPFRPANSGNRALMTSIHSEQFMVLDDAEIPTMQTGYETRMGEKSSSFIQSDGRYEVLARIEKYSFKPGHHYYLITRNLDTGVYDIIERSHVCKNKTESFGFIWNNEYLDSLNVGEYIQNGNVIKTSIGFDEYNNKKNGTNLLTTYISMGKNLEDSVILSDVGADKLKSSLIDTTDIAINDNDILRDCYGNGDVYKAFPDIGEQIKDGIFCSIRRVENDNILFTLDRTRLKEHMISDRNILLEGTVVDIDVYCNSPSALGDSYYNQQLYFYHKEKQRFASEFYNTVINIVRGGKMSYELEKMYSICERIINGVPFYKNNQFSNVLMEVTVVQPKPMGIGDKIADRYGGKGVVSLIIPQHMMPRLDNGRYVDCIKNQSTCINRENLGQLHEMSMSYIGMKLLDYFSLGVLTGIEMVKMYYEFLSFVNIELADYMVSPIDVFDERQCMDFINMLLEEGRIVISDEPYTTKINVDTIRGIYRHFPFIKQSGVIIPMEDSNGNIRYINTSRKMVAGEIYHYRLKQYAEEKFSVTSLSATNLKNLNTRSKANKMYETRYSKTPIMFGNMESVDMSHMGTQYVVMNLMIYSASPQARRLFEQLLVGDPYNINIQLDNESKNRNAEIINALMKTMGIKLVFKKKKKVTKKMCGLVMCKYVPNQDHTPKTNVMEFLGNNEEIRLKYGVAMQQDPNKNPLCKFVMCKEVDNNAEYIPLKQRVGGVEKK